MPPDSSSVARPIGKGGMGRVYNESFERDMLWQTNTPLAEFCSQAEVVGQPKVQAEPKFASLARRTVVGSSVSADDEGPCSRRASGTQRLRLKHQRMR